jgi:outer membrane lipoprotein-sorting protein
MSRRPHLAIMEKFMCYRIPHCLIAVAFASAFLLSAQTSHSPAAGMKDAGTDTEKARALVEEEARAVQSIDRYAVSHQVDITSVTSHYNKTTHAYIKTWVQRPGHIRAESRQYTHSETIVSDGSATWVYDGGNRTYWKQTGGAPIALFSNAFPGLARKLSSANLPSVITSAGLAGTESLTINGHTYLCDIVDVKVVPSASDSALQDNMVHLWISREYKVPLKVEATFAGATPADIKKYSDYVTDFEPNLKIPESTWTFNPPPEAKQRTGTTDPIQKN